MHEADVNPMDTPVIGAGDTFVASLGRVVREVNTNAAGRRSANPAPVINDDRSGTPRKRSCKRAGRFALSDDEDNEGLPDLRNGLK